MKLKIMFFAALIISTYLMITKAKQIPDGQTSDSPLTLVEGLIISILCFFNPYISGVIFYYGWKTKLPKKAKQANKISIITFFVLIAVVLIFWNK